MECLDALVDNISHDNHLRIGLQGMRVATHRGEDCNQRRYRDDEKW